MQKYYSYCLKADLPSAIKEIEKSKNKLPNVNSKKFFSKVKARFIVQNEKLHLKCDDNFVKDVIESYRRYYRAVLLQPKKIDLFDNVLKSELQTVVARLSLRQSKKVSFEKIESLLKMEFKKRGFFALFGIVSPFRSLMVWKKESSKIYQVKLPERKQTVNVIFLEQFLELGWLHYATFGKYYVGGWAKKNSLYCVKQAYNLESPKFKVHYLAHEAQHFLDYKVFPKLKQVDLEYRAKLAELALTRSTTKFITKLKSEAKNDSTVPHSLAAYHILKNIKDTASSKGFRIDAAKLLFEHTDSLKKQGRKRAESTLLR